MSTEPASFKCLCADCPVCGKELVAFLAYSHRKSGVDSPEIVPLQCGTCSHHWQLPLSSLFSRVKTGAEIVALGGSEVFSYK